MNIFGYMKLKRKYTYPLLVILFTIGYLLFEKYANGQLDKPQVEAGKTYKADTNTYFLPSSTTGQVVHHNYYSLSYAEAHEQAEWVAYELKKDQVLNSDFKRPYFEIDPAVKTKSAHWRNYKSSGYDRGHLCPAADREFNLGAYNETFLTSNISPQRHNFNAGIWNRLEQQVRRWAKKHDGIFVVTAGVLNDPMDVIGSEAVSVPKAFYKILYDRSNGDTHMIAFLIPHQETDAHWREFAVTIDELERQTGIDFFPKLEDSEEEKLEAVIDRKFWGL